MEQPLIQMTIARSENNFGPRRAYNVKSEMASGPRPQIRRMGSKTSVGQVDLDLELVMRRAEGRWLNMRTLYILGAVWLLVMSVATVLMDYHTRVHHQSVQKYAHFAMSHGEKFVPAMLPSIHHTVDILGRFRQNKMPTNNLNDAMKEGFIFMDNRTPDFVNDIELDLLAVGQARVAAESVRADDPDGNWNVFVPTNLNDLLKYDGDSFTDAAIIGGSENIFFPPSKMFAMLNEEGLVIHHLGARATATNVVVQSYKKQFGEKNVRVDSVQPGVNIVLATKNGTIPEVQHQQEAVTRAPMNVKYIDNVVYM